MAHFMFYAGRAYRYKEEKKKNRLKKLFETGIGRNIQMKYLLHTQHTVMKTYQAISLGLNLEPIILTPIKSRLLVNKLKSF